MGKYLRIHVDHRVKNPDEDWVARQLLPSRSQVMTIVALCIFVASMATKALYERAVPSLSFTLWTAGIAFFAGLYFLPLYQYVLTGYSAGFTESMRRYATVYLYRVDRMIGNKELDGNTARKLWRHRGEVAATLLRIKQDWPSKPALVVDNTIVEPPNQFEAEGPPIIEPFGSSTSNA